MLTLYSDFDDWKKSDFNTINARDADVLANIKEILEQSKGSSIISFYICTVIVGMPKSHSLVKYYKLIFGRSKVTICSKLQQTKDGLQ